MKKDQMLYWITTGIFCLVLGFSGVAHFGRLEMMVESMTALGYPTYFMTIIGFAKLVGVCALLAPGLPLIKEWAYAGFCFNLMGAVATHFFVSDPASEWLPPLMLLFLGAASYFTRPADRRLIVSSEDNASRIAGAREATP